jgi:uncharacterized protein YndB with AHSA1/START domain
MRALKIFSAVVGAAIAIFVVIGLARGRTWHVEVSADVNAPPERVFAVVSDLTTWRSWMGYDALDPDAAWDYGRTAAKQQVGTADLKSGRERILADLNKARGDAAEPPESPWMAWSGPRIGHGRLTLVETDAPRRVRFVERVETDDVNARGSIALTPTATGTRLTYSEEGELAPVFGGFVKDFIADQRATQVKAALAALAR